MDKNQLTDKIQKEKKPEGDPFAINDLLRKLEASNS